MPSPVSRSFTLPVGYPRSANPVSASRSASLADDGVVLQPTQSRVALHHLEAPTQAELAAKVGSLLQGQAPLTADLTRMSPAQVQALLRVLSSLPASDGKKPVRLVFDANCMKDVLDIMAASRHPLELAARWLPSRALTDLSRGLPASCVEGLDLGLNQDGDGNGLKDVLQALQRSNVKRLSLKWCALTPEQFSTLCQSIANGARLGFLDLRCNEITPNQVGELARSLQKADGRELMELCLAVNAFGDEGVRQLAASGVLGEKSGCIGHLDVSECAISGSGLLVLSQFLRDSCILTLKMRKMLLNDEDFVSLVQSLKTSNIRQLDISGTPLTPAGARMLANYQPRGNSPVIVY